MRILFISNLYPPMHLGGMELRCEEVVHGMIERGHTCQVLTSNFIMPGKPLTDPPHVHRKLHLEADVYHYQPFDYLRYQPRKIHENRATVLETIAKFNPDLIFFWGMWNFSPDLIATAQQVRPRSVVNSFAGFWPLEPDTHEQYWQASGGGLRERLFRRLLAPLALSGWYRPTHWRDVHCEHAVFCSQFMLDYFLSHAFECPAMHVIFGGIDVEQFHPAPESKRREDDKMRILFPGGYPEHKGAKIAVNAAHYLVEKGIDSFHLTIVGHGHFQSRANIERQVHELQLNSFVTLAKALPRTAMPALMQASDILILATLTDEPLGRTVMEGMACGLVTLASNRAGPPEMITHGVDGLLFKPGGSKQLADLLQQVIECPNWAQQLADEARVTAEKRFTLQRMNDEMEAFLTITLEQAHLLEGNTST